jgi:hypothetical protein
MARYLIYHKLFFLMCPESNKIYLHLKQDKWQKVQSADALTAHLNKVQVTIFKRLPDITEYDTQV